MKVGVTEELVDDVAVGVGDDAAHFAPARRPVRGLGEVQLALDAAAARDDEVAVLVDPALADEHVVHTRRHLVPAVVLVVFREAQVHRACHEYVRVIIISHG